MTSNKVWLPLVVAAVALTGASPVNAAASQSAQTEGSKTTQAKKWDRRDFNGLWLGEWLPDIQGDAANDAPPPPPPTEEDLANDWGFDTRPELKGAYLRDYQQRREADIKAGRPFLATCKPNGMPALMAGPYVNEILQNKNQINWFQEFPGETWRIYLDGRPHPNPDEYPATLTGHSTGKWEGDTLVIETVNVRADTLLYGQGRSVPNLGHSEAMRIVQRMRLLDRDRLQIQGTIEDPQALVKPWKYTLTYRRQPHGQEIIEYLCDDHNAEFVDPTTGVETTVIPERRNKP